MQLLGIFCNFWQFFATFGNFLQLLAVFCNFWQFFATFVVIFGNFCNYLWPFWSLKITQIWTNFIQQCSLHWLLSYSVNTTFREEELYESVGSYDEDHPVRQKSLQPYFINFFFNFSLLMPVVEWGSVTHQMAVPVPSISCCVS